MKAHDVRRLNEVDIALVDIVDRYRVALRRLEVDVMPGFPAKTPGNGDPPGGSGGHGVSITERLASRPMSEVEDLAVVSALPEQAVLSVHRLLVYTGHVGAMMSPLLLGELNALRRLRWCLWAVRQLLAAHDVIDLSAAARAELTVCRGIVLDAGRRVARWGYTPSKPAARARRSELANDPTDQLCRSCLRVGSRSMRFRGDLCEWCYRFQGEEGFLPPAGIVEARASGRRITEAMVVPFREEFRRQQGKPRRRGRRRGRK